MTERIIKLSPEIISLYKEIKSAQKVADFFKINVKTVRRVLKKNDIPIFGGKVNLLGTKFSNLLVIDRVGPVKEKMTWKCECDCGNICSVRTSDLTSGKQISCGCVRTQRSLENLLNYMSKNPTKKNFKGYEDLPGKYISARKNWAFRAGHEFSVTPEYLWELYLKQNKKCALSGVKIYFKPKQTASLDRIDSNLGYTASNVQWTHKDINLMKMNLNQETFVKYCFLISENSLNL